MNVLVEIKSVLGFIISLAQMKTKRTCSSSSPPQSTSPFFAFTQTEHKKSNHDEMVIIPSMDGRDNLGFQCQW